MVSFSSCRSGSGPSAVLSFGAVERNRRKPGGSGSEQARSSGAAKRSSGSHRPAKLAWPPCRERHDRPPRGATAALNRTGAGSDRHETEGQTGQGAPPSPNGQGNRAKLAPDLHPTAQPRDLGQHNDQGLGSSPPAWPPYRAELDGELLARKDAIAASCRASLRESASISGWRSVVIAARWER